MIIVPSSAVETMGLGALGGLTSFGRTAQMAAAEEAAADKEESPAEPSRTDGDER